MISQSSNGTHKASEIAQQVDLLFETSWEVCNKVGGIYAVLSTKARVLNEQFGDKLAFIGPDFWSAENPSPYFKERKTILKSAASKLELPWGITIRTGRWNIPGSPQVILVNPGDTANHLPEIYAQMWERFGVDSLHAYGDYDESCAFSVAASIVIMKLSEFLKVEAARVIAHFDEWTTGMGLLYTKAHSPKISTIFTTHATCIGRSICGNGKPLYDQFHHYDGDQMARELNMESKHSLEKLAAHNADCFTTVSKVTAAECAQLLRRPVDVITPNGFEPDFVPKTVKYNRLRKEGRARLLRIAEALTGKKFGESTFLIATSGRHEYRNKGLDLFLDSVAEIDRRVPADRQVVAFILVPGWVKSPSGSLSKALENGENAFDPTYLTHRLNNEDSDEVCVRMRQLKDAGALRNAEVIYVPCYLDGGDGIVNISYYDILPAFDLTIFPSYYEPWGYTPLESVAFGVPTVTDNKAGFGQWVLDNFANGIANCGVMVVERNDSDYHNSLDEIAKAAVAYEASDASTRLMARNKAFTTASKTDWKFFIEHYDRAFRIALDHKK
ncbi:MAG: glycogen/starch synthase [Muribaculaceae bacterium]|nr:glycogen/starch synthase [Muribaculaceae bacterium]